MKPFRERNQAVIGVVGTVVLIAIAAVVFYFDELPVIGGGTTYSAQFGEAAGLKPDDEVRVAGIKVGEVSDVELVDRQVLVRFEVEDVWIGNKTTAEIKIKTLLGQKYLSLYPIGDGPQDPDQPIPRSRTVTPYDVVEAFEGLSTTVGAIDTELLAKSFRTLSDTFRDSPRHVRTTLDGLSALSKTIASRDDQLAELLRNTREISKTLADSNTAFEKLIKDGNLLLTELNDRRDAIHDLLVGSRQLAEQLSGLVEDNRRQLAPALEQLGAVTDILQRHTEDIDDSLRLAGPYFRVANNALGNGRWIDNYICGLIVDKDDEEHRDRCRPPMRSGGGR